MKQFLLPGVAAMISISGMAADLNTMQPQKAVNHAAQAKAEKMVAIKSDAKVLKRIALSNRAEMQVCRSADGRVYKRIVTNLNNSAIKPFAKVQARAESSDETPLFEDFSGYDGETAGWFPTGFSLKHDSNRDEAGTWGVIDPSSLFMNNTDGYAAFISFDMDYLDEWLVTPKVHVGDDMALSFMACADPVYFFSMENVDWDTFEYIGDKVLAADLQVMVSTDGGQNWQLLKALSEDYLDWNFEDLLTVSNSSMEKKELSLAAFAGKDIKLAFRYVGTDGNSNAVDDIRVGKIPLALSYFNPFGSLYYGISKDATSLSLDINVGPSCAPVTWLNTTENSDASFTWSYFAHDNEWRTSTDFDLTETYYPDYSSEFTTRNNLYYTPLLAGKAAGFGDGAFTRCDYYQAGGRADFEVTDRNTGEKSIINFGLSPIDLAVEDFTTVVDTQVPVFGYDGNTDNYWTNYTFSDEGDANNWVKMHSIMDVFFTSDAPMVIDGLWVNGLSRLKDGASFTAEICPLNEEGYVLDPIATAVSAGDAISTIDMGLAAAYTTISFTFDQPVVMSSEVCDQYVVRFSGFNDPDHVEYFNPFISQEANPDGLCLGYIVKDICFEGEVRQSMTALYNYLGEGHGFLFTLDAYFPWLSGESECGITAGSTFSHPLDSYHAGEALTVEGCPSWLTANVTGRYGETALELTASPDADGTAEITVKGHGVSHKVNVKATNTGVSGISSDASGVESVYTLDGVKIENATAPGVYIVKTAAGKVEKRVIR